MSLTIKDFDLRATFALDKKLLLFAGCYPRSSSKNRLWYLVAAATNWFFSIAQLLSMTMQMVIDRNNLSKLSESLQYYTTLLIFIFKLINLLVYKRYLLEIEGDLSLPVFYGFAEEHFKSLKDKIRSSQAAGTTFRVLSVAAVAFWGLPPFLDNQKSKTLPMPGWFPYNVTKYYYPTFVFQILGIANTAYTDSTLDILSWMLISIAAGQFAVLKKKLQSIDYGNVEESYEEFIACIEHHKQIVKFVYKMEILFSKGIFLQFFASIVVICFTGFLMLIVPVMSMQFGLLVTYFFCMMCQVAMYCWYGHDVMTTSRTIGESLYMSNWYESNLKIRKSIIIFMEKTKKPVILTAGGFVTLSLTTLTSILRSSYSYFAVLRKTYSGV